MSTVRIARAEAVPLREPTPRRRFQPLRNLQPRDRKLLLTCFAIIAVIIVLIAVFAPREDDENTVPSTFSADSRGAMAAYRMLEQSGYRIERWEQPLDKLVDESDEHTVLILAEPNFTGVANVSDSIHKVLDHGGRVLATGLSGGYLLPEGQASPNVESIQGSCTAAPEGFDALADSGAIHMRPATQWRPLPNQRVQYTCNNSPVVVSYAAGKGTAVWWASSQPFENASINKDGDLALLLSSIGPPQGARVVWDESMHKAPHSPWAYTSGTPVHLLWVQLALIAVLLLFSFSRRSGPLLPDPVLQRDAPLEFVQSLGALYEKAGATNTAVKVAYDRFRQTLGRAASLPDTSIEQRAQEMTAVLQSRMGEGTTELEANILLCESAAFESRPMPASKALGLVRSLWDYEERLKHGARAQASKVGEF